MKPRMRRFRLPLFALGVLLPALVFAFARASDTSLTPAGKLLADDGSTGHNFGLGLDIDGETAVIGAPGWDNDGYDNEGAAYVFTRDAAGWGQRVRLTADDGGIGGLFGVEIALDGDTLAVGIPDKNLPAPNQHISAGAVAVYTGAGASWTKQATLMPDDLVDLNFFGRAIALEGDTLIVGAYNFFSNANEAAYVFHRIGNTWEQEEKLTVQGANNFGFAVALRGDVALVGAPGDLGGDSSPLTPGVVYVFTRSGVTWSPAGSFAPDDGEDGDNFGCAIDFDGQTAVVAACEAYGTPTDPGHAYVFVREGANWTQQAKLTPDVDGLSFDIDGVALYGDRIALSSSDAPNGAGEWPGAAFVYERQGESWANTQTLYAPDAQSEDNFGYSIALAADTLLVGAPYKNYLNVSNQGAAYAFASSVETAYSLYLPVALDLTAPPAPGGLIVYSDSLNSNPDIFTIDANGGGKTNLTNSPEGEYDPRWSPDRKQIAFVQIDTGVSQLMVMNADGSGAQAIPAFGLDNFAQPDWSPDGTKLAFSAPSEQYEWDIFVIDLDSGELTNLTSSLSGEAGEPSWSPDGTQIVFRHFPTQTDLVVVNLDDGEFIQLTDDATGQNYPHWSPDGESILFFGGFGGSSGIWVMPAAGGAPQLLIENATHGRWSPDMTHIVFTGGGGGIFRAAADGSDIVPVNESSGAGLADW